MIKRVPIGLLAFLIGCQSAGPHLAAPTDSPQSAGLIVATTAPEIGAQILTQGGSAVDAALATSFYNVVKAGGSYVSFAGILSLIYFDAATNQVYYLNAGFNTPLDDRTPLLSSGIGGQTALVPGFFAGAQAAHQRFGKLPFKDLFTPAINAAENGMPLGPDVAYFIQQRKGVLTRYPQTLRIFTKPDGSFYNEGDLFRQPELAATLRHVSSQGADYIYRGPWAANFINIIQGEGGRISLSDMRAYTPTWQTPLHTTFRDCAIFAAGDCSREGINIIEACNLLEMAKLKQFGHYTRSPQSFFWLSQILGCNELTWLSPDQAKSFQGLDLTFWSRAKKDTAMAVWKRMQDGNWPQSSKISTAQATSPHTDAIIVVDGNGNVAILTHTINTLLWGKTGLFVDGISIPDSGAYQQAQIHEAGPGHRLPDTLGPLFMTRNRKPYLAASATGSGLHERDLQIILNIVDFDMDPQAAHDAPYLLPRTSTKNGIFDKARPTAQIEEGRFDNDLIAKVRALGQPVKILKPQNAGSLYGYWVGIKFDPIRGPTGAPAANVATPIRPSKSAPPPSDRRSDKT